MLVSRGLRVCRLDGPTNGCNRIDGDNNTFDGEEEEFEEDKDNEG